MLFIKYHLHTSNSVSFGGQHDTSLRILDLGQVSNKSSLTIFMRGMAGGYFLQRISQQELIVTGGKDGGRHVHKDRDPWIAIIECECFFACKTRRLVRMTFKGSELRSNIPKKMAATIRVPRSLARFVLMEFPAKPMIMAV